MKVSEFIEKHKINRALGAGFKEHVKLDPDSDVSEDSLTEKFQEFAGVKLDGSPILDAIQDTARVGREQKQVPSQKKFSDDELAKARTQEKTISSDEKEKK
ncbi:hypothetical protein [Leptospira santarosai]|uniref:hypothetical protein n=1 Tax=Leptospira santarosai TaxID=28183 RepID=UPI0002984EEA|nr:hypothetical protein [Leptospira santarosai]EKS08822.1 hypothetical protein LEP1GSC071_4133 [Leptospira santarosai str. JET]MDI7237335.1 hypothetical protein [Leptospira santarosai]